MHIEFAFDLICPWSYLTFKRLENLLHSREMSTDVIVWRPFLLNPDMPREGMPREIYLQRRFGSDKRTLNIENKLLNAGAREGLDFAFDKITHTPNTFDAHRLVRYGSETNQASKVVEALLHAYFVEGRDIGLPSELKSVVESLNLGLEGFLERLKDPDYARALSDDTSRLRRQGVDGTPTLLFNGHLVLAGAQETVVMSRMMDVAEQESLQES